MEEVVGSDILKAVGEGGGSGGQVELGVIRVTVEFDVVLSEDVAKREEVGDEQEGPKDRTLGYTRRERGWLGIECFKLNELSTAREI